MPIDLQINGQRDDCDGTFWPGAAPGAVTSDCAGTRRAWHARAYSILKYGLHLPLNRQSTVYAREGIDLDVSTLADWVGAAAATLMPLVLLIRQHVFAAERIHADDTTVPVLGKGQTRTGRLWTYVRDDRPFGGRDPPAAAFFYSPDRGAKHPEQHLASYAGLMQADAFQPALWRGPQAWSDHRGSMLGACTTQVLRPRPARQGADCHRSGRAHRRPVRHRARDQR